MRLERRVTTGGNTFRLRSAADSQGRFRWTKLQNDVYKVSGDTGYAFNSELHPGADQQVVALPFWEASAHNVLTSKLVEIKPLENGDWTQEAGFTWNFVLKSGTRSVYSRSGVIRCYLCMSFVNYLTEFDVANSFKISLDSDDIYKWGQGSIRYLTPAGASHNMMKILLLLPYSIQVLKPYISFSLYLEIHFKDTQKTNGSLSVGEEIRGDLAVEMTEEWGRISVPDV